ncbi:MAG: rhodanese-like domain-containing protein [Gemmatimonadaceae bacterium]
MQARVVLASIAAVLGAGALVAGSPEPPASSVDVTRLAHAVETEADHIDALQLAAWIRDQKAGLRVIDVRTVAEYEDAHIPTAEHVAIEQLPTTRFRPDQTVVLYSEGGAHAAQGWVFLQLAGVRHSYFLRGGMLDWEEQVMSPTLEANATDSARSEYAKALELSRYFGGEPHRESVVPSLIPMPANPVREKPTAKDLAAKRKKRGC